MTAANALYYGDCLAVMEEMPAESVDLIYLDPPFNSNADYHAIYKEETGRPLPDQVEAFSDMWRLDAARERAAAGLPVMMRRYGLDDDVAELWRLWANALRKLNPSLLAYLSYMTERLVAMRRLLKPDGSVYLHCDPTASHYLKMVMDAVFGHQNFRNEIIWRRTGAHGGAKRWGPIHDTLRNVEGAKDLWRRDPYHFQKWAVEQVDGFVTTRRAADGGVDGRFALPYAPRGLPRVSLFAVAVGQNLPHP